MGSLVVLRSKLKTRQEQYSLAWVALVAVVLVSAGATTAAHGKVNLALSLAVGLLGTAGADILYVNWIKYDFDRVQDLLDLLFTIEV